MDVEIIGICRERTVKWKVWKWNMGNQATVQEHLTWLLYNVLLCLLCGTKHSFFGVASAKNGIEWR